MEHRIYNLPSKKGFQEPVEVKFFNGKYIFYEYKNNHINESTWDKIIKNLL